MSTPPTTRPMVVFPSHPAYPRKIEPDFEAEREAARRAGFETGLVSHEAALALDREGVVGALATGHGEPVIYRGWMMPDTSWRVVFEALEASGYTPLVSPEAYAEAHYLPRAYEHLRSFTARTTWTTGFDRDEAWRAASNLGQVDRILKDHVKSAKHRWKDACFLPADITRSRFEEVLDNFVDARGSLIEKGFVFREFLPLASSSTSMLGAPVHEEIRMFFWRAKPLPIASIDRIEPVWRERFTEVARRFASPFVTLDAARTVNDEWALIESGDGGVSGIPPALSDDEFYSALAETMAHELREPRITTTARRIWRYPAARCRARASCS